MKTNKSKLSSITKALLIAVPLVVAGLLMWYFFKSGVTNGSKPKYTVVNSREQTDQSQQQPADSDRGAESKVPVNTKTTQEVPVAQSGSLVITELEQSNGYVNAKAESSNFTPSQCVYSFVAENSRPVIVEQSGGCTGISVSQNEFDKIGIYILTVTVYGESNKLETKRELYIQ